MREKYAAAAATDRDFFQKDDAALVQHVSEPEFVRCCAPALCLKCIRERDRESSRVESSPKSAVCNALGKRVYMTI